MPNDDLRFDLIALYFNHVHHKIPFLHEHSFMLNIKGHRTYLVNMIYALGSIYQDHGHSDSSTRAGDFYYERAVEGIDRQTVELVDYNLIGTFLLLFKYCKGKLFLGAFAVCQLS